MMIKNLEKYWLVSVKFYLKLPALVRYYIEPNQTNHNNHTETIIHQCLENL